ncbi:sensor domain-containing protein [Mangrovactinospora gilvigrisea]|nr:sensor domain-containing protein [Mangrovactinospora gilvigrisea]
MLRAPFSRQAWGAHAWAWSGLPVAIAMFAWSLVLVCVGAPLISTALGIPVLALLLTTARGLGAMERGRAAALLGPRAAVEAPEPLPDRSGGVWLRMWRRLGDPAGWKAVLYAVVSFPWSIVTFVMSATLLATGWALFTYPAWAWVYPRYTSDPGMQFYGFWTDHPENFYLTGVWVWATAAAGLVLVLVTPWVMRGLTAVDAALVRGLLGRRRG